MKKLTKTLLTATLILGLPLGAYAAAPAAPVAADQSTVVVDGQMDGSHMNDGKHQGRRHHKKDRQQNMTPEQMKEHLQKRYDNIKDDAKKATFIQKLNVRADGMIKHAQVMKEFADAHK
ncbi:MAG: hypothetical protein ACRC8Q_02945 [Aeromonas sp.]